MPQQSLFIIGDYVLCLYTKKISTGQDEIRVLETTVVSVTFDRLHAEFTYYVHNIHGTITEEKLLPLHGGWIKPDQFTYDPAVFNEALVRYRAFIHKGE